MDEQVGGVHGLVDASQFANRIDDVGRGVHAVRVPVVFPARTADAGAGADAFGAEDLLKGAAGIARLVEQGEGLISLRPQRAAPPQRADRQIALAFVADHQEGVAAVGPENQDRLFESRIEVAAPGEVGEVLAIAVDQQVRQPPLVHPASKLVQTGRELLGRHQRSGQRFGPEIRPLSLDEAVFGVGMEWLGSPQALPSAVPWI